MQKNVASQKIGCQLVSATDGSAFTGAVTVYVTGDAGTQAAGSVGAGACTHEGNGYHTYAPAQAETNYDLIAFTFVGTGAVPATVQVFTRHDANVTHWLGTAAATPTVAGVPEVDVTHLLGTAWLAPGTAGTPDVNVKLWNALTTVALPLVPTTAGRTLDVSAGGEAGVDWANVGSPTTALALTGTTIAVTQKVDVETIKTQTLTAAAGITFGVYVGGTGASALEATAQSILDDTGTSGVVLNAAGLAADAVNEIADQVWDEVLSGHAGVGSAGAALSAAGGSGDPWSTALPGAYGAGTAGYAIGTYLTGNAYTRLGAPAGASIAADLVTIDDFLDTEIAAIKTKTDFLPSATAGSSGGLLIAGSNAGTTTFANLTVSSVFSLSSVLITNGVVISTSTTDGNGVSITGNGFGYGLRVEGGATGHGGVFYGGATSGAGLILGGQTSGAGLVVFGTLNDGVQVTATGASKHGVVISGGSSGTSDGVNITAGTGGVASRIGSLTVTGATTLTGAVTATNASNDIVGIDVAKISGDATAANNAESFFDGTGYAGTNNVIPTVTTLTNLPAITSNWLTAAGLATDAVTEIQSGLSTLTAAQVNAEVLDVVGTDTLVAGVTIKEAIRRIGALTSGIVTGAGTGSETFKDYAASASTIVITVDSSGNRSAITYN